jgi:hypothetical protein
LWCGTRCSKIPAADRWEVARLIRLLLSLVTCWSVVALGVLKSIDDAWHANPAVPMISSCATDLSHAYPPRYSTFKDDQRIRTCMPKVKVHFYLQILTGTDCYR